MTIGAYIGILSLVYIINILLVEMFSMRPYWIVYVPGLPVLKAALYVVTLLVAAAFGVVAGVVLAGAILIRVIILLPMLWQKEKVSEAEAYVEPKLRVI